MVDLHIGNAEPTAAERSAVAAAVGDAGPAVMTETERLVRSGRERRVQRRHLLLPVLHAVQRSMGWISPGAVNHVADQLQVPPAEVFGVATFYHLLRTTEPTGAGPTTHVCVDPACRIAGAEELRTRLEAQGAMVDASPCLGQCERAPALFVQGRSGPDHVPADRAPTPVPQSGMGGLRVLARAGRVDPTSLADYRAQGGYVALERSIAMGAAAVIEAVMASGLSGRGGAAFSTGAKWQAVADAAGPIKHVVANCDESEPGTFKDRWLLELDPFAVVEAMTIAAVCTGATTGWVYVRGEYPLATSRMSHAIVQARAAGLLGPDVAGSGHAFDIEVRRGAGAYVCGEETALFASIEGFRGEPRSKPPYPTTHGLFGQPTVINNPETLCNVAGIVLEGADAYRSVGTAQSPGTKLFCLSGRVVTPGVYEVPFGTTLGELLALAGGVTGELAAVLLGGAAGSFVGPRSLDLPLTLEDARRAGVSLGSGVVMAFAAADDLPGVVSRIAEFFRDESCGQCVPCRVGTQRQHEVLVAVAERGIIEPDQGELLDDLAQVMADASICGLGHTASGAVASARRLGLIGGQP